MLPLPFSTWGVFLNFIFNSLPVNIVFLSLDHFHFINLYCNFNFMANLYIHIYIHRLFVTDFTEKA